MKITDSVPRTI